MYVAKYIKYVSDNKQYDLWILGNSDQWLGFINGYDYCTKKWRWLTKKNDADRKDYACVGNK